MIRPRWPGSAPRVCRCPRTSPSCRWHRGIGAAPWLRRWPLASSSWRCASSAGPRCVGTNSRPRPSRWRTIRKSVPRDRGAACLAGGLRSCFVGGPGRSPWTVRAEPRRRDAARFQCRTARGGAPTHGRHAARRRDFSRPPRLSSQCTVPMGPLTGSGAGSPVRTACGTRFARPWCGRPSL